MRDILIAMFDRDGKLCDRTRPFGRREYRRVRSAVHEILAAERSSIIYRFTNPYVTGFALCKSLRKPSRELYGIGVMVEYMKYAK